MSQYKEIKPILQVDRRTITVKELIATLQEYPDDSTVHFSFLPEWCTALQMRDVTPVVDMDTNKTHPVINIENMNK